jgi:hypothetical protein
MHVLQPGEDVSCSSTATADEVSLAAAAQLELAAWQARMPLAALLTNPAMQRRHQLMLLHLMALAEAGCCAGSLTGSADCSERQRSNSSKFNEPGSCSPGAAAGAADDGSFGYANCNAADITAALQQYGLVRCDLYQMQFLQNSAVLFAEGRTSDDDNESTAQRSSAEIRSSPSGACMRVEQQQQLQLGQGSSAASVAELLVWLSRSGQTEAVLRRILEVAKGEQQLAQQVRDSTVIKHNILGWKSIGTTLHTHTSTSMVLLILVCRVTCTLQASVAQIAMSPGYTILPVICFTKHVLL